MQYGSIEEAYAHVDAIMPARARESLRNHYDLAQMSKTLATIDLQVPYTLDETAARIENLYIPEALELCRRLEFKNLLGRFSSVQEDTKKSEGLSIDQHSTGTTFSYFTSFFYGCKS